jgi:hypothetical protein
MFLHMRVSAALVSSTVCAGHILQMPVVCIRKHSNVVERSTIHLVSSANRLSRLRTSSSSARWGWRPRNPTSSSRAAWSDSLSFAPYFGTQTSLKTDLLVRDSCVIRSSSESMMSDKGVGPPDSAASRRAKADRKTSRSHPNEVSSSTAMKNGNRAAH